MDNDNRIEQFRKMAEADPENELGHFSLAKAYMEKGLHDEATASLTRVIELNANMSKAYQMLGEAYDKLDRRQDAIEWMSKGLQVADKQGDRAPRKAMAETLTSWGVDVPAEPMPTAVGSSGQTAAAAADGFLCARCGNPSNQLAKPPFKGTLGEQIMAHSCATCWKEWIPMGTKVINELSLTLSSQEGQDSYDQYMIEFLQLEGITG